MTYETNSMPERAPARKLQVGSHGCGWSKLGLFRQEKKLNHQVLSEKQPRFLPSYLGQSGQSEL